MEMHGVLAYSAAFSKYDLPAIVLLVPSQQRGQTSAWLLIFFPDSKAVDDKALIVRNIAADAEEDGAALVLRSARLRAKAELAAVMEELPAHVASPLLELRKMTEEDFADLHANRCMNYYPGFEFRGRLPAEVFPFLNQKPLITLVMVTAR